MIYAHVFLALDHLMKNPRFWNFLSLPSILIPRRRKSAPWRRRRDSPSSRSTTGSLTPEDAYSSPCWTVKRNLVCHRHLERKIYFYFNLITFLRIFFINFYWFLCISCLFHLQVVRRVKTGHPSASGTGRMLSPTSSSQLVCVHMKHIFLS